MPTLPLKRLESPAGRALVLCARVVVGAVFAFAAVPKLLDPASFAEAIRNYHIVSDSVAATVATGLPVFELIVAASLLTGVHSRGAATLSACMLLAFAIAMTQAILRGINTDCGCFGSAANGQTSWLSVGRNAGLTVLSLLVLFGPSVPWWRRRGPNVALDASRGAPSS